MLQACVIESGVLFCSFMEGALRTMVAAAHRSKRGKVPFATSVFRDQAEARKRKLVLQLQRAYKERGLALYLGAGVSVSAGLPDWKNL